MLSLSQQLQYNWERGFYSVVQDSTKRYSLFTTKDEQGGIIHSPFFFFKEDCLTNLGTMGSMVEKEEIKNYEWKIVDTIHPSELMGKGFQVGDKVTIPTSKEPEDVYEITDTYGRGEYSISCIKHEDHCHDVYHQVLKPVLPVEEERAIKRENGEMVLCSACDKYIAIEGYCFCPVGQAMKVLYEKGIIKDGKIVNL